MGSSTSDYDEPCGRCGRKRCEGVRDPKCLSPREAAFKAEVDRLKGENERLRADIAKASKQIDGLLFAVDHIDHYKAALEQVERFDCKAWSVGVKCDGFCPHCIANKALHPPTEAPPAAQVVRAEDFTWFCPKCHATNWIKESCGTCGAREST